MSQQLTFWRDQLGCHFQSLATQRVTSGLPIFALEHGLTPLQIKEISDLLREQSIAEIEANENWLLWVIFATEVGYGYTGDEYWQSFVEEMPYWEYHHRNLLRDWFKKFRSTYHGVQPSGPWADNFPIIAWPITHAVVPRNFQLQFIQTLHQCRHDLANLDFEAIGKLLAISADDRSPRFKKFLQQTELTGRIVQRLLHNSPSDEHEPILSVAFDRLVEDIDNVRKSKVWLRETRYVVDQFRGVSPNGLDTLSYKKRIASLNVHPKIFLRCSKVRGWDVAVEIPNLTPLAALTDDLQTFLKQTRCRVAGAIGTKPARWVLSSNRVSILNSWPDPGKPLLKFEQDHDDLDHIIQSDCVLSPGPIWLFRMGSDDIAREIKGHTIRPGVKYILVSKSALSTENELLIPCSLACDGVYAFQVSVSEKPSAEYITKAHALGLKVSRSVSVWPTGLSCRNWDGEGQSEWLTTESPRFGIVHDHPVDSYLVCLDNGVETRFNASSVGEPLFIQLTPLSVGQHSLRITAQRDASISGIVELSVREPAPWIPGVSAHSGLTVSLSPHDADLDKFWSNKTDLFIRGPDGHRVECVVSLETSKGKQLLSKPIKPSFPLPVKPEMWRSQFSHVVEQDEMMRSYVDASVGKLEIRGGELGKYEIRFERDVLPLRWVTHRDGKKISLRLVDDTGFEDTQAKCQFFSMENPVKAQELEFDKLLNGFHPCPPGGLFSAQHGNHDATLIVSSLTGNRLSDIGLSCSFDDIDANTVSVTTALRVLRLWSYARAVGFIFSLRQKKITAGLLDEIYAKLCGQNWAKAERKFSENPASDDAANKLRDRVGGKPGFSAALKLHYAKFREDIEETSDWYTKLSSDYQICSDPDFCRLAVYLAREPYDLPSVYEAGLDRIVKQVVSSPQVLRGARYAVLLRDARDAIEPPEINSAKMDNS